MERLLRPLAEGAPEALGLADDAAVIPSRPGFDLVVTKDAIVEGVHFLPDDRPEEVARKLLRVNLSDLAAKGAEPFGYFLAVAWPAHYGEAEREAFVGGLAADQAEFGVKLLGGDTVCTPGPFTASVTMMGWTPAGQMVRRDGARPGQVLLVTGTIGDGGLGLKAAQGFLEGEGAGMLAARYRRPEPRLGLREALRAHASACIDISDGLIADAIHIEEAGKVALQIDLERLPLSPAAQSWLALQPSAAAGLVELASAGDDYELLLTADVAAALPLAVAAAEAGFALTPIGRIHEGQGATAILFSLPFMARATRGRQVRERGGAEPRGLLITSPTQPATRSTLPTREREKGVLSPHAPPPDSRLRRPGHRHALPRRRAWQEGGR
ncbi:MAG: thiamine-phosphate kinase [Caulobacterales bacterium 32-69-10]|nr:MAG: thiamine-phosphate kinase [Caulobacterales bacterium 32-69-10]